MVCHHCHLGKVSDNVAMACFAILVLQMVVKINHYTQMPKKQRLWKLNFILPWESDDVQDNYNKEPTTEPNNKDDATWYL